MLAFWNENKIVSLKHMDGIPSVAVVKILPANAADARAVGLIPELGRSPGEGNGKLLQYSCLEISMDREVWWATVHAVTESQTRLSKQHIHVHYRINNDTKMGIMKLRKNFKANGFT